MVFGDNVAIFKLKKYLRLALVITLIGLLNNKVNAIYVIDRCVGGYRRFYYPDAETNMLDFGIRHGIQTIFTVKFKDLKNVLIHEETAFLSFVPDISDEKQVVRLMEIAFPHSYDRKRNFVQSVMRLAATSYSSAIVRVHVVMRY